MVNVVIAATGSVATVKLPLLVDEVAKQRAGVKVVMTKASRHFVSKEKLVEMCSIRENEVYVDEDEWEWAEMGDPVLHIELAKWADVLVIAPLSANTMAKLACGLCDNLVTCLVRAWDHGCVPRKPIVLAPAMNTKMWEHPVTSEHLATLRRRDGAIVVDPVVKTLACKDVGIGAMAPPEAIIAVALQAFVREGRRGQPAPTQP
mmetsp:Transcript_6569/g.13778  ORF Transcript_6569/g.13778 Transcript_6569/m.13778 type:complete len:204 (-) Transcript_6569:172-783(-)